MFDHEVYRQARLQLNQKMKNIFYSITCLFTVVILFSSCEESTMEGFGAESIVIQSYLFAENPLDSFYVRESISYADTSDEITTIDDLSVSISDGTDNYFLQSIGDGYYQNLDLIIENGKTYSMEFENEGTVISAETYVPEKKEVSISLNQISIQRVTAGVMMPPTETDPITVSWENNEGEYYYVIVENIEGTPEYINENFGNATGERPRIITEPQIISDYNVDTRRDIQFFGTYRIVVYRVNPEYAALYSTSEATSSSIIEPITNIENGLGIMTGISSDTITFEVNEL